MGYGAYDGGGSVEWHVEHGNGNSANAPNNKRAHGKDLDPPSNKGGKMAVWINGVKLPTFECDGSNVVVAWGKDALGATPPSYKNPDSASGV